MLDSSLERYRHNGFNFPFYVRLYIQLFSYIFFKITVKAFVNAASAFGP